MRNYADNMKILLFAASFPPPDIGGSTEYLHNIVKNMPLNTVTINTANAFPEQAIAFDSLFGQRIIRSNFIHHPMEAYRRSKLQRAWQYVAWPVVAFWRIIKERPDIVHIGEANMTGLSALFASWLLKIPYLHYVYAEELTEYKSNWLRNELFWLGVRRAQAIVTVSEYSRHMLVAGGVLPERIHKVLPAIGAEKCERISFEKTTSLRKRYGVENNRVLLTAGALKERKGQATVIEALPIIMRLYPTIKYIMAGSGEKEVALRQRVQDLGLGDHVVFAGRVDNEELNGLYEICDVFVMPHRQVQATLDTEGCPTVFLEASAHGKPVIGGNAGGVADAILDGRTGFIIDGTNTKEIADSVCMLLENPGLSKSMGQAGCEYTRNLTPERNADSVWQISKDVVIAMNKIRK